MSFSLNGTPISGGTFYSVSGNMSQVINSNPILPARQRSMEGAPSFPRGSEASDHIEHQDKDDIQADLTGPATHLIASGDMPVPYSGLTPDPGNYAHAPFEEIDGARAHATTFNSVGGDMTQVSVTSYGESGIDFLYHYVAVEALHNSGERFPEPACHPGTRTTVLDELRAWALDTNHESSLLWLNGSAGAGKSAIAQMFAGECAHQSRLGASFFFRRGHLNRGTWHKLFTTISYQLATSLSEFRLPVQQVVDSDKLVVGRAMAVQFEKLLVDPFNHTPAPQFLPIIVLDGLDECEGNKIQQEILRLFIQAIRAGRLPVRILIASRPEPHLRKVLEADDVFAICRHFELSADQSAYDDIRNYLRDEFSRINWEYKAQGIDLGTAWPGPEALEQLVRKSSGTFIYAATVVRFVDDEYYHPVSRLDSVFRLDPNSTAPLDDLYTQILSSLPPYVQHILHAVWRGTLPPASTIIDPEEIDMLLNQPRGTSRLALRGLHSLVKVPPIRTLLDYYDSVTFLHASFADFLVDERRSGKWLDSTIASAPIGYTSFRILDRTSAQSTLSTIALPTGRLTLRVVNDSRIIIDLCNMTYDVFRPFLQLRDFLYPPFPVGDAPQDFLADPIRAGVLYCDPHDTAEEMALLLIYQAKEFARGAVDYMERSFLQDVLPQCGPNPALLREFQSLEHHNLHYTIRPTYIPSIVEWLMKFPVPPTQTIAFWEKQIAIAERRWEEPEDIYKSPRYSSSGGSSKRVKIAGLQHIEQENNRKGWNLLLYEFSASCKIVAEEGNTLLHGSTRQNSERNHS
ncbi:hypothetical protein B0H19DRAFT_1067691 [Mycena capillaripes]|nr:hypothetical protein B0H19DRAFT_1067691 [Mycena capillaripes]